MTMLKSLLRSSLQDRLADEAAAFLTFLARGNCPSRSRSLLFGARLLAIAKRGGPTAVEWSPPVTH
jgi:hypothetical protein